MKINYPNLSDTKLDKNTVIVRANLNLKFKNGEIDDDSKIKALIPTLTYLQERECKTIILTHLGEDSSEYKDELSLLPIRFSLGRSLNKPIKFVNINNCQNSIKFMEFGDILLIENLCFSEEEFSSNKTVKREFIEKISQFAEYYVNESFGVDSKLASTSILSEVLKPLLGISFQKELESIKKLKSAKKENFISLIGGNISDKKIAKLEKLAQKSQIILLGGEIALLFLKESGLKIENEKITNEFILKAKEIKEFAKKNECEIVLPVDVMLEKNKIIETGKVTANDIIKDIGPKTIQEYQSTIEKAKTLVVNGTMGVYEEEEYWNGTNDVFETAALLSHKECYKVIGGDDTMEAIKMLKIKNKKFGHISSSMSEYIRLI